MRLLVINPNSTQAVTDGISSAVESLRIPNGPSIDCHTLAEGPPGIESDAHITQVGSHILNCIRDNPANAYIIACFSDPALDAAREQTNTPVFGISESAYLTALTQGERFGVISILPASIPRHIRYIRRLGLQDRFAGDRAIGMGVTALGDAETALNKMASVGRDLIERDGADVLILGCAGMATQRQALADLLGIPVIEPCQAACAMALGQVLLSR